MKIRSRIVLVNKSSLSLNEGSHGLLLQRDYDLGELSSVIFFESSTHTGNKSLVDARTLTRCVDDSRCLFLLCLFSLWFHSCTVTWICYVRITNPSDQHLRFALSEIFNNNNICAFLSIVYKLLINYRC